MTKEKEVIEVPKSQLDEMMKKIERLEYAASNARLQVFDDRKKVRGNKVVGLRVLDGKVVTSWSDMLTNIVEKNQYGKYEEDQTTEIHFEDGTKQKMPLVQFTRRYTILPAEVKKTLTEETEDGKTLTSFVVKTADEKEYTILDTFVN